MNKTKSVRLNILKYTLILPAIMLMISTNVVSQEKKDNTTTPAESEKVYVATEKMPEYKGGTKEMMNFILTNLKYPVKAAKKKVEGRVIVRFVVSETGEIRDAEIVKSLNKECDAEAIRVVNAMPNWTPGYIDGKAVPVYYTLPIMYKLTKEEKNKAN